LGGLVSSTAVTISMSAEVKDNKDLLYPAVFATAIASCTMFLRILVIVLVLNRELFLALLPHLAVMAIVGVALAYRFFSKSPPVGKKLEIKDPFKIIPALEFGLFFAIVLVVSKFAITYFGDLGAYAASMIAGLADVDAIVLSMATLSKETLDLTVAANAITLAAMTNTFVKLAISYFLGTVEFGNKMATIFIPMVIAGIIVVFIS